MYNLYKKNELRFSIMFIIIYVVLLSIVDTLSASLGIEKIITAPACIVFVLFIFAFVKKYHLLEKYGLCSFVGNLKTYLYFIPLIFITSVNLWYGVTIDIPIFESVLFIVSMLCVGFIEEMIFRGFLFKAISQKNRKLAIFISSVTFGIGHIVNLLNGSDFILTLLQMCYAIALGFLFTIIFYKGKSLWPCIIAHGVLNSLSVFAINNHSVMFETIVSAILCVVSLMYALWILKKEQGIEIDEKVLV